MFAYIAVSEDVLGELKNTNCLDDVYPIVVKKLRDLRTGRTVVNSDDPNYIQEYMDCLHGLYNILKVGCKKRRKSVT